MKQGSTLLATYYYDYRGRRSRKVTPTETTIYLYDLWDHLLGEFNGTGSPLRTYIWKDDTPVAVILHGTPEKVLYLETDHLNTPIAARDENAKLVWKWESDAFGSTLPNEDPDGDGVKTTINLRFPGQFYDKESGFHYNHHRYYDPVIGRYLSSDPIGLAGGRNSFGYVGGNPLSITDPRGLDNPGTGPYGPGPSDGIWICNRAVSGFPFAGNHAYLWNGKTKKACSMRGSSGFGFDSASERGPGNDSCYWVPGSQGREDDVMRCCQKTANAGVWTPGVNDCHNAADYCLNKNGLSNPGAPGGRGGTCDSCNTYPNLEASGFGNLPAISF